MLDQGRVEAPFLYLICLLIPFLLRGEEGEDDVWSFGQIEILQDDSDSADGLCSGTFFFFLLHGMSFLWNLQLFYL